MVPISSIPASTDTKKILVKQPHDCRKLIVDSYLILQPMCKLISTTYSGSSLGFIEQDDLLYIETKLDVVGLGVGVDTDNDDEPDDDASVDPSTLSPIPRPRSYPYPDSNDKVKVWITKSKLN